MSREKYVYNPHTLQYEKHRFTACLLYTSDAADERSSVDLGGRRIIKKKHTERYRSILQFEHRASQTRVSIYSHPRMPTPYNRICHHPIQL